MWSLSWERFTENTVFESAFTTLYNHNHTLYNLHLLQAITSATIKHWFNTMMPFHTDRDISVFLLFIPLCNYL